MPTKITGELRGQMWPAGSRVIMLGAHLVPPNPACCADRGTKNHGSPGSVRAHPAAHVSATARQRSSAYSSTKPVCGSTTSSAS
jgi:hypothetical protein